MIDECSHQNPDFSVFPNSPLVWSHSQTYDAIDVTGGADVDGAEVVAVDEEAPAAEVDGESPPLEVDGSWSFLLGDVALPFDVDGRLAWAAATLCEY